MKRYVSVKNIKTKGLAKPVLGSSVKKKLHKFDAALAFYRLKHAYHVKVNFLPSPVKSRNP